MLDLVGETFDGRFRIEKLIGKGGMGAVFLARHLSMGKEVAIKVLSRELSDDPNQVERFNQEAQNSSRLRHPNTIRVFDFGRAEQGFLYLAMEYLEGLELSKVLKRDAPLSADRALHILRQLAKSLAEAHNSGLIHRDVKPDNIFLSDVYGEQDFVKVLDFGIAKVTNAEAARATRTQPGFLCGTPTYLAPEIAMGTSVTPATDIYSTGVVAYQMLTGRPPYRADSPIAVVMKHIHDPVPVLGPEVRAPEGLKRLIGEMLSKDPAARPADADALLERLESVGVAKGGVGGGPPPIPREAELEASKAARQEAPTLNANALVAELSVADRNAQTSALPFARPQNREVEAPGPKWGRWAAACGLVALLAAGALLSPPSATKADEERAPVVQPSPPEEAAPVAAKERPAPAQLEVEASEKKVEVREGATPSSTLRSVPPGALVREGSLELGVTPLKIEFGQETGASRDLTLQREGYLPKAVTLTPDTESVEITLEAVKPKTKTVKRPKSPSAKKAKRTKPKRANRPKRGGDRWKDFEAR